MRTIPTIRYNKRQCYLLNLTRTKQTSVLLATLGPTHDVAHVINYDTTEPSAPKRQQAKAKTNVYFTGKKKKGSPRRSTKTNACYCLSVAPRTTLKTEADETFALQTHSTIPRIIGYYSGCPRPKKASATQGRQLPAVSCWWDG